MTEHEYGLIGFIDCQNSVWMNLKRKMGAYEADDLPGSGTDK